MGKDFGEERNELLKMRLRGIAGHYRAFGLPGLCKAHATRNTTRMYKQKKKELRDAGKGFPKMVTGGI